MSVIGDMRDKATMSGIPDTSAQNRTNPDKKGQKETKMEMFGQEWAKHAEECKSCQTMQICPEWLETVKKAESDKAGK